MFEFTHYGFNMRLCDLHFRVLATGSTQPGTSAMPPFSVSPESFGVVQSVNAWHAGVRYPGEAVVARVWDARWGAPLTGSAMFRVILLPDR